MQHNKGECMLIDKLFEGIKWSCNQKLLPQTNIVSICHNTNDVTKGSLVFVPFIGIENYGARRWIGLFGVTFQPSELAKFALVLFASAHLADNYEKVKSFKTLLPVLAVGGLFCLLVILEPNMSITMCLGLTLVFMLVVGGISFKHFSLLAIPGVAAVPALIFMEPYRIKRLMAFLDPWASPRGEGFQLIQSLYSLGSGGWFGVGLFNSRQKHLFLPFCESDFIFSIIAEEIGFLGSLGVMAVYATLIVCLIKVALSSTNRFAALLVTGVAIVIAVQVLINIAVVTGSIPPTGLPLPFVSAGGTSLMVFMSAIGVCLNVRKQNLQRKID
jgi:cell division protein FtsW